MVKKGAKVTPAKEQAHEDESKTHDVKRLYRSNKDKVVAGVCGGIAEYLSIDPVWVRLVAVLSIFLDGIGILVYLIAWILMPRNPGHPEDKKTAVETTVEKAKEHVGASAAIGMLLVVLGGLFLMKNLFDWFSYRYIWPIAIICSGVYLLWKR